MKKVLLFLMLMACSLGIHAQTASAKEWTLQECIQQAIQSNIRVQQARLNAESARTQVIQNIGIALPDLNGSASHVYNFGKTIDPFTNTFANDKVLSQNFSIASNLTLFSGFRNINSISQARIFYQAVLHDIKKTENDISLSVASAYLQIIFNTELVLNARKQLLLTEQQVARTRKLVDAGSLAIGNLYDIQAQQASEELNLISMENQLQLSSLDLAQLMNLEDFSTFRIQVPLIEIPAQGPEVSAEQTYQAAITGMPQVKSAELKVKSSFKGLQVARGGISPRLSLFASMGTGYSGANKEIDQVSLAGFDTTGITASGDPVLAPAFDYTYKGREFSDQIADNFNRSVGFRLTVPLMNGFQNRSAIRRAKIETESSELTLEQSKLDLRKEVQKAYLDASGALKKYNSANKALEAMLESFRYTQQRYDVGVINSFDYNTGKTRLAKAESDLLQAKYEYIFKLKVLDFYQGKPLTF